MPQVSKLQHGCDGGSNSQLFKPSSKPEDGDSSVCQGRITLVDQEAEREREAGPNSDVIINPLDSPLRGYSGVKFPAFLYC